MYVPFHGRVVYIIRSAQPVDVYFGRSVPRIEQTMYYFYTPRGLSLIRIKNVS